MLIDWVRSAWPGAMRQTRLIGKLVAASCKPSLRRIAANIVTVHLNGSVAAKGHRYPSLKRLALKMSDAPIRTTLLVASIYGAALWLGIGPAAIGDGSVKDIGTVNVAILGVQGALIGLVFPLVIAFVGLLNQGRASFASRLTIYIESTIAVFVGLSSLLLCVAISLQLAFASMMEPGQAAAVTGLNLLWFVINVVALGYFVLRTLAFLHPARRTPLIRAYVANVVWPRELAKVVTRNRWDGATSYGYLPESDEDPDIFSPGHGARIWYGAVDFGEPQVLQQLWSKKRLVDIRLGLLDPIIRNWLAEVTPLRADAQHDFVVNVEPDVDYDGDQYLVRTSTKLGLVSTFGIWCAFAFRRRREDHGAVHSTSALLSELMADLLILIDARQVEEFSNQLREIINYHFFFYELAQSPVEDFNYALTSAGRGLFGYSETLGPTWARAYRDVASRAAEILLVEPAFFGRLAHAPASIYGRARRTITPQALRPLIELANMLAYRLIDRGSDERPSDNPSLAADALDRAWRDMAAGWELLLQEIGARGSFRDRGARTWADFQRFAENVIEHLRLTTELIAHAVWRGDELATRWTADFLLHWRFQAQRAWESRGAYWLMETEGLTLNLLRQDWAEVAALPIGAREGEATPTQIFGAVMHNGWHDHLVIMASVAIHWALHGGDRRTTVIAARMLLQDEPHDVGDTGVRSGTTPSGSDTLVAILRIKGEGSRFADESYAGRFEHILEQMGRIGDRPAVSLRIYSSSGGLSFDALVEAQVIAIMALSVGPQQLGGELRRQLTKDSDEALVRRESHLEAMLEAAGQLDQSRVGPLLAIISDLDAANYDTRLGLVRRLIEEALAVLRDRRAEAIVNAPIDPARIAAVTAAASGRAFDPSFFPLNLFAHIEATTDELEPFTLNTQNLSKGSYTDPLMGQIVINEDDWWREAVGRRIAATVWTDALRAMKLQELEGRTPEDFWRAVHDGSERIRAAGQDPVLVLQSRAHPEWLNDWRWPYGADAARKPANLVITELANQSECYAFSMNDTPVYEAPSVYGLACLIPAQLLERVRYHDYGGGAPVSMAFTTNEDDPWTGTMSARFERSVELSDLEGFRIRFAEPIATEGLAAAQEDQAAPEGENPAD